MVDWSISQHADSVAKESMYMALVENRSDLTHQTTSYSLYREYLLVQKIRIEKKMAQENTSRALAALINCRILQNICKICAQNLHRQKKYMRKLI